MPAASSASTAHPISGRPATGTIGFGIVYVTGRRRVPYPAARIIAFIGPSQLLRRKDHVFAEVRPRPPRHPIQVRVRLPDRLIHVHAEVGSDAADHVHRAFDLEIVADGRAVEDHFDVLDAPDLAELLVAKDRLVSERVEELD